MGLRASFSSSDGMRLLRDRASIRRTKINGTRVHPTRMHVRTRTFVEHRSDTLPGGRTCAGVHEREPIAICHHPHRNLVGTIADDSTLKLWRPA